jgi:hypothetical protein
MYEGGEGILDDENDLSWFYGNYKDTGLREGCFYQ